jgi:hypothetical protein
MTGRRARAAKGAPATPACELRAILLAARESRAITAPFRASTQGKTALMNAAGDASPKPILVEVGAGELLDKVTILRIKRERIADPAKLASVARELLALEPSRSALLAEFPAAAALESELERVNEALWEIEDSIRRCEARKDFGPRFVALARAVYQIKKTINILSNARIVEEKSYFVS